MSNATLELILASRVGTPGYTPSTEALPATTRPVPARRQIAGTALAPRIAMSRPSEPQKNLIKVLLDEIEALDTSVAQAERALANELYLSGKLTPGYGNGASERIEHLKGIRASLAASRRAATPQTARPTLPEGCYAVSAADDGHTVFYRVDVSTRGYYTVSLQVSDDLQKLDWAHSQAVIKQIEADGPLASAQRYGRELGRCPKCHRTLTNPASIAAGIGPICAAKYGS